MKFYYLFLVSTLFYSSGDCNEGRYGRPTKPRYYIREERGILTTTMREINPKWNATWTDKLKRDLLLNYDKFARPFERETKTKVTVDLTIMHVELDEIRSIMVVHAWTQFTWTDDKLKWNSSEYGDITTLHLADHEIWQPDILVYNRATGNAIDHYGNTNCLVSETGSVLWVPPSAFHVFCELNLKKWPFDTQTCSIVLGSWTYNGNEIDLDSKDSAISVEQMLRNPEWKIVKTNRTRRVMRYSCCPEPYVDLTFDLTLERRSPTYKALVITPITAIVLMTLATFWLPPKSGDKLLLGGSTAIIICLFLLYFTQKVTAMTNGTPLIVSFYSTSLYLVAFSVVLSVIVINISKNPKAAPLPSIIKTYLTGGLGCWLCINGCPRQASSLHHTLSQSSKGEEMTDSQPFFSEQSERNPNERIVSSSYQDDWIMLAVVIDRISFLIYSFLFIVFAIAYSI